MNDFIEYDECPRCGFMAYERLSTHSYCGDCNYSPDLFGDLYLEIPDWALRPLESKPATISAKPVQLAKEAA